MNAHKIFNPLMAFIFAFSLLGVPAPVSAQDYNPAIQVWDSGRVDGTGWPQMGGGMTLTIDDPTTPQVPDFSAYGQPFPCAVESGTNCVSIQTGDFQFAVGQVISLTDVITYTKEFTITSLLMKITDIDPQTDIVSGTAEPGSSLFVSIGGLPDPLTRYVTADDSGKWHANFANPPPWFEPYDIVSSTNIYTTQCDLDNDCMSTSGAVPTIMAKANFETDWIQVWGLPDGTPVALSIDDPATGPGEDYAASGSIQWIPDTNQSYVQFELAGTFDIQPGQVITVTGDGQSRSITVANIWSINVNLEADTVFGYVTAGVPASVSVGFDNVNSGSLTPDANGFWQANFGPLGGDVRAGTRGFVQVDNPDGSITWTSFQAPNPTLFVDPNQDKVWAWGWPDGALLPLEIDDPATSQNPDYSISMLVPRSEVWDYPFNLSGIFDIQPGMKISINYGGLYKWHVVTHLAVTDIDLAADTVSGTADPGSFVHVGTMCNQSGCANRNIIIGPDGHFVADFATSVTNPSYGIGTFDLRPGVGSSIFENDEDYDSTRIEWRVPNPRINVRVSNDQIDGSEWVVGSTVNIEINNPGTPQNPDLSTTANVVLAYWDPSQTTFSANLNNYDLKVGDIVTASSGNLWTQMVIPDIKITNVDMNTETVYGTTEPNQQIRVEICQNNGQCVNRDELAGPTGLWEAHFDVPGDQSWEQATADIRAGSRVEAYALDENGNSAHSRLNVTVPAIYARLGANQVEGEDWQLGDSVTLRIEDMDPATSDYTATQTVGLKPWNPNETYLLFDLGSFTLAPGQIISMYSDSDQASYTVVNLAVTAVNMDADTVSGTADPGTMLTVGYLCDPTGCIARTATANELGNWMVDFSVPGPNQKPEEQRLLDIRPGTNSQVLACDAEFINCTGVNWSMPNPTISARVQKNTLEGWGWPLVGAISVTIDDPATQLTPDYTGQTVVFSPSWSPTDTVFDLDLNGEYELKPGDMVTVSNGTITKTHLVTNIAIQGLNPSTGIVTGIATPGGLINVSACDDNACIYREKRATESGNWEFNLSIPGDQDWEQATIELKPGTWIDSGEYDEDWDQTLSSRIAGSTITGVVYAVSSTPGNEAVGVLIEACAIGSTFCGMTLTNGSGRYALSGLPAGTYNLRAIPPGLNLIGYLGPLEISYDETLSGQDITISAPPLPPPADAVFPARTGGGTLSVFWSDALTLTTSGCTNGTASFDLTVLDDGYTANGAMTETSTSSGTYTASIPAFYPHHGVVEIIYTLTCPGGAVVETDFFIYIDPSGLVKDTSGAPVSGATVTLLRSDTPDGPFELVPDGSNIMSPSNRSNPMTTAANGEFGWDVVAGFYKVRAEKPGCVSPDDPTQTFVESAILTIPPPVTGLELVLKCQPVNNAPAGLVITAPLNPVQIGQFVSANVAFSDPDAGDTHTITWDWGDGSISNGSSANATHFYTQAGVYVITATVTDAAGASASASFSYVVIYDPTGGFVTGAGWYLNPATGAKIHFGFNPKYQKKSSIPKGETEVKLEGLKFNSTSHEWLIINGAKAQFKGSGTLNGTGNFGILITIIDGKVAGRGGADRIRIKIWNKASGEVVYDSQPGAADNADPTTMLKGGSITVHKPK